MRKVVILSISPSLPLSLFSLSLSLPPFHPLSHSFTFSIYLFIQLALSVLLGKNCSVFSFLEYQKRKKKCLKKSRNLRLSFNAYLIFKIIFTYSCKIKWYKYREHFQKLHIPQHVFF